MVGGTGLEPVTSCMPPNDAVQTSRQREDLLGRIYTTHDMVTK
jgi:hypothetical protein